MVASISIDDPVALDLVEYSLAQEVASLMAMRDPKAELLRSENEGLLEGKLQLVAQLAKSVLEHTHNVAVWPLIPLLLNE